jgi:membrane protein YqaA with SNARE-associated domain
MPEPPFSYGASNLVVWLRRLGLWLAFIWGVAEATLFFIVPDVVVGAVATFRPRRAMAAAGAAIAGALVGGMILYGLAAGLGSDLRDVVEGVPGIPPEMVARSQDELLEHGGLALVLAPFSGTPYKIYAAEWAIRGWGLPALLAWTVPARAIRIVPIALIAAVVGMLGRKWVMQRSGLWLVGYGLIWTVFYIFYFRANGF